MNKTLPKISEAEWRLMKILWRKAPLTANQLVETLSGEVKWNHRTIKTLLNRLVNKRALSFDKVGRTYNYYPVVSEADCVQSERKSFLNRIYGGSLSPMLAAFIKDTKLSPKEIEELKQILEQEKGDKS